MAGNSPWWDKPLSELSASEWEALCDGCGKCCLNKIMDEDSGDVYLTSVACRFLDLERVACRCYPERTQRQRECLALSPESFPAVLPALPDTCAYRLRWQGRPIPDWHPLRHGGEKKHLMLCGQSVKDRVVSETDFPEGLDDEQWEELIILEWSAPVEEREG